MFIQFLDLIFRGTERSLHNHFSFLSAVMCCIVMTMIDDWKSSWEWLIHFVHIYFSGLCYRCVSIFFILSIVTDDTYNTISVKLIFDLILRSVLLSSVSIFHGNPYWILEYDASTCDHRSTSLNDNIFRVALSRHTSNSSFVSRLVPFFDYLTSNSTAHDDKSWLRDFHLNPDYMISITIINPSSEWKLFDYWISFLCFILLFC